MRHATRRKSRHCPIATHIRRVRPMLEQLEDRITPSTGPGIILAQTLTPPHGSPAPGQDGAALVTVDSSGRIGMFWEDPGQTAGTISGEVNGSQTFTVATQTNYILAAAADTYGDIAVAWQDTGNNDYISFFTAAGTPLAGHVPIGMDGWVSLAGDSVGDFMVTWANGATSGPGASAEVFDAHGNVLASTFAVVNSDYLIAGPVVVADSAGSFVVLWANDLPPNFTPSDPTIQAQRCDARGNALNAFQVADLQPPLDSSQQISLSLSGASDGNGNLAVVWQGDESWPRPDGTMNFSTAIAAARISDQGVWEDPNGVEIAVDSTPFAPSDTPDFVQTEVALDSSGDIDVVYSVGITTYAERFGPTNSIIAPLTALAAVGGTPANVVALPNDDFAIGSDAGGHAAAAIYTSGPPPAPPQAVTPLAAADQTAFANVMYRESQNYLTDPAGNALTYTATLANGDPLPAWLRLDTSGILSGIPDPSVVGTTLQVRVTAMDPYGATAVLTLPITVAPDPAPSQPNGGMCTVAPVAVNGSPAASNEWIGNPVAAVNAAGDSMIVCGMLVSDGQVIMGQMYNALHQPVGPVFEVNGSVGGLGNSPTVTADAAGDFDVNWQAGSVSYLQRFSPKGAAVGAPVILAAEQGLEMVADPAGDLDLLWNTGPAAALTGIYMRRFDTSGNKLSATVQIAANGTGYQAAASPGGNVMVVWDANQQVYMRLFSAQLTPLSAAVAVGGPGVGDATVAADGLGNFDVAFLAGNTVEFERFNNLGQPIANAQGTGPTVVATGPLAQQSFPPQVVADGSGNFTIVWSSVSFATGFNEPNLAQRYDPTGRPVGGAFLIPIGASAPSIAGDPIGDLLVTNLLSDQAGSPFGGQWYWPTATVHVPGDRSTSLNTALVFSAANDNAITLTGGDPTQLETLTLTTGSNATLTTPSRLASLIGNGTPTIKLTGTSPALNAALQGLSFHAVANAPNATLQVTLAPNAAMSVHGSVPITLLPPTGPYFHPYKYLTSQVATPPPGYDSATTVTIDPAGHTALFWQDLAPGASAPIIYGDVSGSAVFHVSNAGTIVAASSDTNGDIAIAWQSDTVINGISGGYYVSFYSSSGAALGGPVHLTNTTGWAATPQLSLAGDDAGRFLVAWQGNSGLDAQVLDPRANSATPVFVVTASDPTGGIGVAVDRGNEFAVVWYANNAGDTAGELVGQVYDQLGNAQGTAFVINSSLPVPSPYESSLSVASDGGANLVAIWPVLASAAANDPMPGFAGIAGQRFTDQGSLPGGQFSVNSAPIPAGTTDLVVPQVAMDGADNIEVVYATTNSNAQGNSVYAERFGSNGNQLGTLARLNTAGDVGGSSVPTNSPAIGVPTVAANASGEFVFGWTAAGNRVAVVYTGAATNFVPQIVQPVAASDMTAYANMSYYESQNYFRDPEGDPLSYTMQRDGGGALPAWLHLDDDGRLWGTPTASDVGESFVVIVTATDSNGGSNETLLPLTVAPDPTLRRGGAFTTDASASNDIRPAVALNAAGDAMAVMVRAGDGTSLVAQMYNAQGQPFGGTFAIQAPAAGLGLQDNTPDLTVTADAAGDFDVAWVEQDTNAQLPGGSFTDVIYLERFSPLGAALDSPVLVVAPNAALNAIFSPHLSADGSGNLVLTWASELSIQDPPTPPVPHVFVQRFNVQGASLTAPVLVTANAVADIDGTDFTGAVNAAGNVLVAWQQGAQMVTQVFDANLHPLGTPAVAGPAAMAPGAKPSIAVDGLGNFDLVWLTAGAGNFGNIVALTRYTSLGTPIGNATGTNALTLVTPLTRGDQDGPQVAADAAGNFTVVWLNPQQDGTTYDMILGQRYNSAGVPTGGTFRVNTRVNTTPPLLLESPAIAADPPGNWLTAWSDGNNIVGQWYWPTATVHVPAAQATSAGAGLVFSTANGNAITLTGGSPTATETLTLQVSGAASSAGTLSVTNTAGLASISGNGTAKVTLTGTSAVLNSALQGLTIRSTAPTPNLTLQVTLAASSTMAVNGSVPIAVHNVPPPQVVTPLAAADKTAHANVLYYESQSYFTDAAGNLLIYSATLANGSALPAWLHLDNTGRLFGVSSPGVMGTTYQVRVMATDPYGGTAVLTLPITVAADPTQPNGSAFTVAPVAVGTSAATSNAWTGPPAVAVNGVGDAMIVGGMSTTGGEVIMGQVYSAQHQRVGPVFQVNRTVGGTGNTPIVTADAAGDFDVAWQAGTVAYMQRFSPLGVAVGSAITLAAEQGLEMVGDAAGDLVLLWRLQGSIYMRRFDTLGNKLSPTVEVAASGTGYHAAASPSGNFMVAWQTNQQAYLRMYNAQLSPLGAAVPLGGAGTVAVNVAADGLGNFDVALLNGNTIEFERFNNSGQPIENAQGGIALTAVATDPSVEASSAPQVVADRSGNFTIVWSSSLSANVDAFGQRYDAPGRPVGGTFAIPLSGGAPSIAGDSAGDLLATDLQGKNLGGQWYWPTATMHVPAAQSTSLTSTLVFSTANHNAITLTGGNPTQVETLMLTTSSAGTLTVIHTTGLSSITGNGTSAVKLTGTSAVLNAALQALTFHPVASALTPTLKLTLAPNAAMSVSGSVPITVHVSAPPPIVTMPAGSHNVAAGSTLVFSTAHADAITLTDPDAGSTLETLTLFVTTGTLKLSSTSGVQAVAGNGTGEVRVTGTLGALNTALNGVVYTPALGAKGSVVFNAYIVDSANAMGWASTTLAIPLHNGSVHRTRKAAWNASSASW